MKIEQTVYFGTLIHRYKRFLADVKMADGTFLTVHCPNSGSMKTCNTPGWKVAISDSANPRRKLRYTWEMIHNEKCWIGVNTQRPNKITREAIETGVIKELQGYSSIKPEQKYGENSRIDLLLEKENEKCFVEVKNVSLVDEQVFMFPDAVTVRGLKHLNELISMKRAGHRAVLIFVIQRTDGNLFMPAVHIDPAYATKLKEAEQEGVEIMPYLARVSPQEIKITHKIGYDL